MPVQRRSSSLWSPWKSQVACGGALRVFLFSFSLYRCWCERGGMSPFLPGPVSSLVQCYFSMASGGTSVASLVCVGMWWFWAVGSSFFVRGGMGVVSCCGGLWFFLVLCCIWLCVLLGLWVSTLGGWLLVQVFITITWISYSVTVSVVHRCHTPILVIYSDRPG